MKDNLEFLGMIGGIIFVVILALGTSMALVIRIAQRLGLENCS